MIDMSFANCTQGRLDRALRISLYGVDGIGKTSFGAGAPNPIFLATEDGSHHVDVTRFPVPEHWLDIVGQEGAMAQLYNNEHEFRTLVVDSMDWAETLCDQYIVQRYNQQNQKAITAINEIPYGAWKAEKLVTFGVLLDWLSVLVRTKNMHIVLISHAKIVKFNDPERDTYERYELKLYREVAAKVREWSDYNLFCNYDTVVSQVGTGFDERDIGLSHGKRLLFSQRKAAYDAKARFPIPDRLDLSWETFWAAHKQASQTQL